MFGFILFDFKFFVWLWNLEKTKNKEELEETKIEKKNRYSQIPLTFGLISRYPDVRGKTDIYPLIFGQISIYLNAINGNRVAEVGLRIGIWMRNIGLGFGKFLALNGESGHGFGERCLIVICENVREC